MGIDKLRQVVRHQRRDVNARELMAKLDLVNTLMLIILTA